MASSSEKREIAFKHTLDVYHTRLDKQWFEESYGTRHVVPGEEIWGATVPFNDAALAITNSVAVLETDFVLTEDPFSDGRLWVAKSNAGVWPFSGPLTDFTTLETERVKNWISPVRFGPSSSTGYSFILKQNDGTPIPEGDWEINFPEGLVHLDDGNTAADNGWVTPLKLTAYRYTGALGTGGGGGTVEVQEDGSATVPAAGAINFIRDFKVAENPGGTAEVELNFPLETRGSMAMTLTPSTGTSPPDGTIVTSQADYDALGYDLKYAQDVPEILPNIVNDNIIVDINGGTVLAKPNAQFYAPAFGSPALFFFNGDINSHRRSLFTPNTEVFFRNTSLAFLGKGSTEIVSSSSGVSTTNTITDGSASWANDEHVGRFAEILTGPAAGEKRPIEANSATVLTVVGSGFSSAGSVTYRIVEPATVFLDSVDGVTPNGPGMRIVKIGEESFIIFDNIKFGSQALPIKNVQLRAEAGARIVFNDCMFVAKDSSNWWLRLTGLGGITFQNCSMRNESGRGITNAGATQIFFLNCLLCGKPGSNKSFVEATNGAVIFFRNTSFKSLGTGTDLTHIQFAGTGRIELEDRIRIYGASGWKGVAAVNEDGAGGYITVVASEEDLEIDSCDYAVFVDTGFFISFQGDPTGIGNGTAWRLDDGATARCTDPTGLTAITDIELDGESLSYSEAVPTSGSVIVGQRLSRFIRS